MDIKSSNPAKKLQPKPEPKTQPKDTKTDNKKDNIKPLERVDDKKDDKKADASLGSLFSSLETNGAVIYNLQPEFVKLHKNVSAFKEATRDCKEILALSTDIKIIKAVYTDIREAWKAFDKLYELFIDSLINNPAELILDHYVKGKIYWLNHHKLAFKQSLDELILCEDKDKIKYWGTDFKHKHWALETRIGGKISENFNNMTKTYHDIYNHFLTQGVWCRVYGAKKTERDSSCAIM